MIACTCCGLKNVIILLVVNNKDTVVNIAKITLDIVVMRIRSLYVVILYFDKRNCNQPISLGLGLLQSMISLMHVSIITLE